MEKSIELDCLHPNPDAPSRMSRYLAKKLQRNIEQIGHYETIVVRPHARRRASYEILNGFARVEALRRMGRQTADCCIWELDDEQARLYLAARDAVRGEAVPELRMDLLLTLLDRYDPVELSAMIPETEPYLRNVARLRDSVIREEVSSNATDESSQTRDDPMDPTSPCVGDERITLTMRMTRTQYAAVKTTLNTFMERHSMDDMGEALVLILKNAG